MSIFANIVRAIFGSRGAAEPMPRAEVEKMISKLAVSQDERSHWRTSVVDLMKLLKLDSSLKAREQLAEELGYKGKFDGSEKMNTWLHDAVMNKLSETGGKVPDSFRD